MNPSIAKARHYVARIRSIGHVHVLRWLGYEGSRNVQLDKDVRLINPERITLEDGVQISRHVKIACLARAGSREIGRVELGRKVFVGERTSIISHARIIVGNLTMIGHNCSLMDFNHGMDRGQPMGPQPGQTAEVKIGEDCWLGAGVIVLPGVTIGNGTIVGAGAVVTRNLPENVVAGGVPARVLRNR